MFSRINLPELIVILAPNHTGFSDPAGRASIWPDGEEAIAKAQDVIADHPMIDHVAIGHRQPIAALPGLCSLENYLQSVVRLDKYPQNQK